MPERLTPDALALLDRALAAIDADPSTWNQRTWACETGGCIAGHIAHLVTGKTWPELVMYGEDVQLIAADALGLTAAYASGLFAASNSRRNLQAWRDLLAGANLTSAGVPAWALAALS
jgi:hypothetical protein